MRKEVQIEASWKEALHQEWGKSYFTQLTDFLRNEYAHKTILPEGKRVFNAFNSCSLDKVKVVLLGQDPYPTPGHANGLCFSVNPDVRPFPKSLNNIFEEIKQDLGVPTPENGDLSRWAQQGVFLLNTVLTVEAHNSDSHAGKGWEIFTDKVIHVISEQRAKCVFLLWGSKAQQKASLIDASKHLILQAPHPSPLSAYRGFFGCKHFSKTNTFLVENNQSIIQW